MNQNCQHSLTTERKRQRKNIIELTRKEMYKNTNNLIGRAKNQAATPDNKRPCQWSLQINHGGRHNQFDKLAYTVSQAHTETHIHVSM